jgi:hypothetical protein
MTFKFYSNDPVRAAHGDSKRSDHGAATIVILMMSLVFVPIAAAHLAVLWHDHMQGVGPQQIAGLISQFLNPGSGAH